MKNTLYKIFKWDYKELLQNTIGVIIFSFTVNMFIQPNNLYSGGIFGLAQLLNKLANHLFSINSNITSIIYFAINIPLFILAFFKISKSFCARTMYAIVLQTILLMLIPIPNKPLINDLLTNVLIAGTLVGIGIANILSSTGSTGGTDIIGIVLTSKYQNFSVGRFALMFNSIIFGISGIFYGIPIMIYSIMYSIVENISIDKLHEQNVSSSAIIFTKKKPEKLLKFVRNDLNRGATSWVGTGEYDQTKTYITYLALSRYELHKLEKYLKVSKEDVFLVKNDYVGVDGNFAKRLSR